MKAVKQFETNKRLRHDTVWKLLATENAPFTLALLETHLLDQDRRLSSSILTERIHHDLEQLRLFGENYPQSAQNYITQWLSAGFLGRSYEAQASEEMYELSAAAIHAIRFIQGLKAKRSVATESRLSMVIQQLVQLVEQTEPDPDLRVENLLKERQRIDNQIAAIRAGKLEMLADDRALERTRELIALADELANEFRQVRTGFQKLNRKLRERIMDSDGSRGDVLESMFAGVDLIADSDEGRTFKAFWRLLTDPEQSMEFEIALDQVVSRDFASKLERHERQFLLRLTGVLLERGGDVHEVLHHFARGLKHFVQTKEYQEQKRINTLLKQAQRKALEVKEQLTLVKDMGYTLDLTSSRFSSLSQLNLRDPSLDEVDSTIELAPDAEISLQSISELVANSEINFRALVENIKKLLDEHSQVSIATILEYYPAVQGLGSIVGYISLGSKYGVVSQQKENVSWFGMDNIERSATIPCIYFVSERRDELR